MNHKTGFLFHELYMWHDTGSAAPWYPAGLRVQPAQHAESAESKRRLRNLMEVAGILDDLSPVRPRAATRRSSSGSTPPSMSTPSSRSRPNAAAMRGRALPSGTAATRSPASLRAVTGSIPTRTR